MSGLTFPLSHHLQRRVPDSASAALPLSSLSAPSAPQLPVPALSAAAVGSGLAAALGSKEARGVCSVAIGATAVRSGRLSSRPFCWIGGVDEGKRSRKAGSSSTSYRRGRRLRSVSVSKGVCILSGKQGATNCSGAPGRYVTVRKEHEIEDTKSGRRLYRRANAAARGVSMISICAR